MPERDELVMCFNIIKGAITGLLDSEVETSAILAALTEMLRQFSLEAGGPEALKMTIDRLKSSMDDPGQSAN